ncbi:MerR family transcriptional regulator [Tabrizicola sp. J26]|uniref:MerR family transcriptional regulator n=1 Tax=Alitabrizicola rongguiensis TaxID=2909234 RepID=UPI001F477973|nr:MerR family transcriptional regulator [Tabrizicola rongguiensis]MCF1710056.1 MerR family transcriptional regulator [Tabrizicola rongguiensis]
MEKSREAFRTISEVSEILDTPPHVLRFWESRFPQVRPVKRAGGRRYYRPTDVALLSGIKRLLHTDGLTIRGVQKVLREHGIRHVMAMADAQLAGEANVAEAVPVAATPVEPPVARVLTFPEPGRDAPAAGDRPAAADNGPSAFPETAVEPDELVDDSEAVALEEFQVEESVMAEPEDRLDVEVSLQLTELIAEFVEQAESEVDETPAAPELPLWANAAPPAPPAPVQVPAPHTADLAEDGGDAADAAETPRGAWIATELRRLTPAMAAPYSAEFSALGRRLEALRARQAAATPTRKG